VVRPRSSSRGRNTSASVTVAVPITEEQNIAGSSKLVHRFHVTSFWPRSQMSRSPTVQSSDTKCDIFIMTNTSNSVTVCGVVGFIVIVCVCCCCCCIRLMSDNKQQQQQQQQQQRRRHHYHQFDFITS